MEKCAHCNKLIRQNKFQEHQQNCKKRPPDFLIVSEEPKRLKLLEEAQANIERRLHNIDYFLQWSYSGSQASGSRTTSSINQTQDHVDFEDREQDHDCNKGGNENQDGTPNAIEPTETQVM
jgi:hypothetical protein